jgi:hypothetical protein
MFIRVADHGARCRNLPALLPATAALSDAVKCACGLNADPGAMAEASTKLETREPKRPAWENAQGWLHDVKSDYTFENYQLHSGRLQERIYGIN